MAQITIVYWRDIPAQITLKAGRKKAKRQLDGRFMEAVDMSAMRAGAHGSDLYLAEWRRGTPTSCGDDLEQEADEMVVKIETEYDEVRLKNLVAQKGFENV